MSNLLKKASIVLTPTAYNDGEALCVKPEDGSGDFDFSRNSAATRVNAQGLVENVQILSSNLVQNGDFSELGTEEVSNGSFSQEGVEEITNGDFSISGTPNTSSWSLGWYSNTNNVEIADGKLTLSNSAIENDARAYATNGINSNNILTTNKFYKLQYDIVENNGATDLKYYSANGVFISVPSVDVGSYTLYIQNTANSLFLFQLATSNSSISIDNVSVKEYLGQEVVPDSGCGSWLFEPQTTQLIPYSEDFSQWVLGGDTTIESGYLAPDGTNNAYKVSGTTSALQINASLLTTSTRSIYARTTSGTGQAHLCSFNGNSNNLFTITDQWQRFDVNSAISTGATTFYAVDFRGSTNLSEIILWGANATNDQDYVTSYIPSNGTTVTRNQDVCTNGGSLASINSTEGVLYAEIAALINDSTRRAVTISDGTTSNRIVLRYDNASNRIQGFIQVGGATSGNINTTSFTITNFLKIAYKWKAGDFALWVNGNEVATSIDANSFSADTLNVIDLNEPSAQSFYGKTKALVVYKEALSDSELQELTTI